MLATSDTKSCHLKKYMTMCRVGGRWFLKQVHETNVAKMTDILTAAQHRNLESSSSNPDEVEE
jgi:hypothetical protein